MAQKKCWHCHEPLEKRPEEAMSAFYRRQYHPECAKLARKAHLEWMRQLQAESRNRVPLREERVRELKGLLAQFNRHQPGSPYVRYAEQRLRELGA